jgi:hypothetical protein
MRVGAFARCFKSGAVRPESGLGLLDEPVERLQFGLHILLGVGVGYVPTSELGT